LETVPLKEIAEAVLSASSAIASLLLVFIAFLFTKADALPPEAKNAADRYALYARLGIVPFLSCVVGMLSSYAWLFHPTCAPLFDIWSIGFVITTILLVAYALLAILKG
jgi:hypothetical protein